MSTENIEDLLKEFIILKKYPKSPFTDSKINNILSKLRVCRTRDMLSIQVLKEFKEEVVFEDKMTISEYSEEFLRFKTFILNTFEEDLVRIDQDILKSQNKKRTGSKMGDINSLNRAFNEKQSISSFRDKYPSDQQLRSKMDEKNSFSLTQNGTNNTENTGKIDRTNTNKESQKPSLNKSIGSKVLPGGKYGLAVYIKYFAENHLSELSFGRILSLINKGIELGLLEHVKVG
jgi:hypothetical protein